MGVLDWMVFRSEDGLWPAFTKVTAGKDVGQEVEESENKIATGSCELTCQDLIEEKIKEGLAKLPSPAGQSSVPTAVSSRAVSPDTKTKVVYVPLTNEGGVSSSDWTDVVPSEFYFNLADYPGVKEVRFEAFLSSVNDDQGYARIYDATNKRGVDFSDLLFSKSAYTRIESSRMVIWNGNNKYTVQLRSANGTKVQIKDAKLKVLF